ncbi:hypothetical protein WH47_00984 [Habropoda laboriosa]|uniref:Uncharacterized protein n=1 Tax=Habropoda laboriosa TaxID=597456 RepID=A0A0L7R5Q0_9HYME|nr:hypothetical protein WH47_00984 [Habropoda laboriosa]
MKNELKQLISFLRKNELDIINELVKTHGQLHTAVIDVNEVLTTVAQNMKINVNSVLQNVDNENELEVNLRNVLSAADFQEKIFACLNRK